METKDPIICFECKKPGHIKADYPQLSKLKDKDKRKEKFKKKKAFVTSIWEDSSSKEDDNDNEETANICLVAQDDKDSKTDEVCLKASRTNKWYIDSSCSEHMTGDSDKFSTLKPKEGGKVSFGGNQFGKIVGIKEVGSDKGMKVENVYYVKSLCHNLLSVSQSTNKNNWVIFDSKHCLIISKDDLSLKKKELNVKLRALRDALASSSTTLTIPLAIISVSLLPPISHLPPLPIPFTLPTSSLVLTPSISNDNKKGEKDPQDVVDLD
ncbi:uncharacterized protein LOC114727528 [Neltuma alba]|uniref:uncharacterized protein LOC114727528 n=1 Tax=Neltuma alba TaxID=207710 RepID=UPI0010A59FC7|nr:uncharacterized protein LOC114727528 [Prosopis alba]